ncbi:TPA: ParA family protein [Vibrio parahaemolyticus]|nr:ParA family protein [Vibrio parahaemolyticus]
MPVVCIANQKGGVGKTSIALNLVHHLTPSQIIDLDVHGGLSEVNLLREKPLDIKRTTEIDQLLKWLDTDELTIIDCGGFDTDLIKCALSQADFILTPSTDDPTDQLALRKFNDVVKAVNEEWIQSGEKVKASVVLNRVHPNRSDFSDIAELIDGLDSMELCPIKIKQSVSIPAAIFLGSGVKSGTSAAQFSQLAKHIEKSF